jgi:two-component system, chemotaxis family, CheB/CheR fusion protein
MGMLQSPGFERNGDEKTFLVLIGSSAGGIEALSAFVKSLPSDLPAAIVIAQHLAPTHESRLTEILAAHSPLPVRTVLGKETLETGTIYVIPPNHDVEIVDAAAAVHIEARRGPKPSIDQLFSTAAALYGDRLIAIVLSGSGSDGQRGVHAVKEAGGTILIQ